MNIEQKTITSVEVAEMMETEHYKILEKLEGTKDGKTKGIIPVMTAHNFVVSEYFIENTYKDASGKENKCYSITKMGCDFLANKFTGEKGILFTAKYVKRFRDMEGIITTGIIENLSPELQAIFVHDKKIQAVVEHMEKTDSRMDKLEFDIPLYGCEAKELSDHVKRKGVKVLGGKKANAYNDSGIRTEVYRDIYDQVKREFGLNDESGRKLTYLALKRKYLFDAHECIDAYQPPIFLQEKIQDINNQLDINDIA